MHNRKLLKWSAIIGVVILASLSLGTIGYMCTQVKAFEQAFAENVYIEDLAVGGLTKEEAKAKLEQEKVEEVSKQLLILTNEKVSVEIPFNDLGITYNIDEIVNEAFQIGHDEGFFKKYKIYKNGLGEPQTFELTRSFDEDKIKPQLESYAEHFYIKPVNATLARKNKQFIITKEVNGECLDLNATEENILTALKDPRNIDVDQISVDVVTQVIIPEYTEQILQDSQTLISSFSTSYNNADANRNENLKVAAHKITRMLLPDEIFYLSNQLEPFTAEAGYKSAGTIVNGKIEDSLGGGICQVGSTLYNAVLLTDIEVVKRQNHSLAVSYVPLGRDATYNTGTIDFQFKNNSQYPLFIEGYCENNQVIVNIYGNKDFKSQYEVKFESDVTEVIPAPETKYKDDPTLDEGKEVVEVTALDGKRVNLYKLYYKNGSLVKRVLVNNSYYRPRAAVIKRGTKKVAVPEQTTPSPSTSINNTESSSTSIPTPTQNVEEQSATTQSANDDFRVIQE